MEWTLVAAISAALLASLFFWCRGMRRASTGDMIAGLATFLVTLVVTVRFTFESFGWAGALVALFGFTTLLFSRWASPACPLPKSTREVLGAGCIIMSFFLATIA